MSTMISIGDLGLIILFIISVVLGVYLIITLKNLNHLLKSAKRVIESNEESVEKVITQLPKVTSNINVISENIKESSDKINSGVPKIIDNATLISSNLKGSMEKVAATVDTVGTGISETVTTVKESTQDVTSYINLISEVIKIIANVFSRNK